MPIHLATKQCPCGEHEFTAANISSRLMSQQEALGTNDVNLYGGNAKRFAKMRCPECGMKVLGWLKPEANSYRVITISAIGEVAESEALNRGQKEPMPEQDLTVMTFNELKSLAKEKGINSFGLSKEKLIEALEAGK